MGDAVCDGLHPACGALLMRALLVLAPPRPLLAATADRHVENAVISLSLRRRRRCSAGSRPRGNTRRAPSAAQLEVDAAEQRAASLLSQLREGELRGAALDRGGGEEEEGDAAG